MSPPPARPEGDAEGGGKRKNERGLVHQVSFDGGGLE